MMQEQPDPFSEVVGSDLSEAADSADEENAFHIAYKILYQPYKP